MHINDKETSVCLLSAVCCLLWGVLYYKYEEECYPVELLEYYVRVAWKATSRSTRIPPWWRQALVPHEIY